MVTFSLRRATNIRRYLSSLVRRWEAYLFQRRIGRALALQLRGEARKDGLTLRHLYAQLHLAQLHVEWQARDVHPWDKALPVEGRASLFVKQTFADTDAALKRLFQTVPSAQVISLRVLRPRTGDIIMSGEVQRSSMALRRPLSDRIWLGQLGVIFRLSGDYFEELVQSDHAVEQSSQR
jgi:hypothetical protein